MRYLRDFGASSNPDPPRRPLTKLVPALLWTQTMSSSSSSSLKLRFPRCRSPARTCGRKHMEDEGGDTAGQTTETGCYTVSVRLGVTHVQQPRQKAQQNKTVSRQATKGPKMEEPEGLFSHAWDQHPPLSHGSRRRNAFGCYDTCSTEYCCCGDRPSSSSAFCVSSQFCTSSSENINGHKVGSCLEKESMCVLTTTRPT